MPGGPQWGILYFLGALWLITAANLIFSRRIDGGKLAHPAPGASLLVPARNEELNIERCVRSLLEQQYAEFEVLVLDDESDDGTGEILARMARTAPRLRVLAGQPLPPGWLGKNWACHQLAAQARYPYLLFVDADTHHHPFMLAGAVATAQASGAALLTGLPRQEVGSWGEKFAIPVLAWLMSSLTPALFTRLSFPGSPAVAVGQFMLFTRQAYDQIGGHAAIKDRVVEDFSLARLVKKHKLKLEVADITRRVSCRMYRSSAQVLSGITKNIFATFNHNLLVFAFIWLWLSYLFWQPLVVLALLAAGVALPGFSAALAAAAIGMTSLTWLVASLWFGLPAWQAVAYPITILFFAFIAARSAWFHYFHIPIAWKGREVGKPQPVTPADYPSDLEAPL